MSTKMKKNAWTKAPQKSKNVLPFLAIAAVVVCTAVVFFVNGNGSSNRSADREANELETIVSGESLEIPIADITTDASFFPVEVDGTTMEIIAVKDSEGNIRTAFNTCQICYDSGRGYYVQSGNYLVCQNCGNRFSMDQVEIESGGCNPWPIFDENKTIEDDKILISYDFLAESLSIFAKWKGNY